MVPTHELQSSGLLYHYWLDLMFEMEIILARFTIAHIASLLLFAQAMLIGFSSLQ